MIFLAEGARMTFFAVEVDHFHAGDAHTSVLVPRTAFVPSWVSAPVGIEAVRAIPTMHTASTETLQVAARMDALAEELDLAVDPRPTGRAYLPRTLEPVPYARSGVGVYASQRGVEVNLSVFHHYGEDEIASRLLAALGSVTGVDMREAHDWPSVRPATVAMNWERARAEVFVPYFRARQAHSAMTPIVGADPAAGA